MGKKKTKETIIYQEQIPEKVIEELEDGQKVQYFIWDALIKRISNLHPELLLPVVKEIFGKEYGKDEEITFYLRNTYWILWKRIKTRDCILSMRIWFSELGKRMSITWNAR